MTATNHPAVKTPLFYRITALWVICEAFAGGLLHAAKIPFTGMIVSGLAVCCIALLAWHSPGKGNILKATIIVAIFKLLLSPHSPPTAYIAVFFQGLMGQVFLNNKKLFTPAVIFVAMISLVESAMQRLLVLWLLYGEDFWQAVDKFIQKITAAKEINNYSLMLASGYVLVHAIVGLLIGKWISGFIKRMEKWKIANPQFIFEDQQNTADELSGSPPKKKKKRSSMFIYVSILLLIFYLLSFVKPEWAPLPGNKTASILLRSIAIMLSWYFLLSPFIMSIIKKQLLQKQAQNKIHFNSTMELLPEMKSTFRLAWSASQEKSGVQRLKLFVHIVLANTIRV